MVANVDDPVMLSHLIAGALRLPTDEKQALLEELDVTKRLRRLSEILARELEVVALGTKIQSQVQSELEKGQREYFLRQQLKAIQEELGEADEVHAEVNELREQLDRASSCPRRSQAGRPRAGAARAPAARDGRVRRGAHLPGVDRVAAVGQLHRGQPRSDARARGARRGPLRHRAGQGPDPRVPGRAQAQAGRARRRYSASWGRRAWARPRSGVDRARARAAVRAHQRRRRARRGRDPRPPANLHRRDARRDHPRDARRRRQQPAADDRRDRQDGRRLPRRSRRARCSRCSTPSRTMRSATTTSTCRSTSRT